jgi:hypothetical protein
MNIKEQFKKDVDNFIDGEVFSKGAVVGVLSKACGGDTNRYIITKYLTGKSSSKDLSEAEWNALLKLVAPFKPEGGKWMSARSEPSLERICSELLREALIAQGQGEFPF